MRQILFRGKRRLVKLTLLALVWCVTSNLFAQITINVQNKPLHEALKEVERVSDYKFFYNQSLEGLNKSTTIRDRKSVV